MTKKQAIATIKNLSCWRTGRNINNYKLPSGDKCSDYIEELVEKVMNEFHFYLTKDFELVGGFYNNVTKMYERNWCDEKADLFEMSNRVHRFVILNFFKY